MQSSSGLTNGQIELLKLFKYDLSDTQLKEIKALLSNYFAEKVTSLTDDLFDQQEWGKEKIDEWANEHMRTPYQNK